MNFGGIDPAYPTFEEAAFVVIPIPYDLTSTYQSGSRRGPHAILEASGNMELYDEELCKETYLTGIYTLSPVESDARGPGEMVHVIRHATADVLAHDKIPVILGGEHSISFGVVQAMREKYPGISVLQLDAHADLRNYYQCSPYSHASVGRRISELCPLVQAGIRSMSAEEAAFMKESTIRTFTADFILGENMWWEKICETLNGDVYITIDIDVLDPSIMPATGTPEPGGIYWKDILRLVRAVSSRCRVRGFDVVELSPIPGMVAPDFLAAKLVYRIIGYLTETK
ncbi:MAG TPA: agmatinase [Syntrophaceae bacterium]|jgi:agmatinase|nr:agmatinase [Syntrophaceae bacterium]